ncbi:hypothetical protein PVK06_048368 [Gossypium arboreum]|uniref:Uncharacterized protein n=1 Tax=Gossypium arboreum TaxID=29729 RepID=A0ABR0MG90_GOSAR|nr:hypothetical protein PVK06_048368 [Gossypium arboreum]
MSHLCFPTLAMAFYKEKLATNNINLGNLSAMLSRNSNNYNKKSWEHPTHTRSNKKIQQPTS